MRSMRSVIALDPRLFGRGRVYLLDCLQAHVAEHRAAWSDFRLFATTFVGGFLFAAIYLA